MWSICFSSSLMLCGLVASSHSSFTGKNNPLTSAYLLQAWRPCAQQEAQGTPCSLTLAELHPPSEALSESKSLIVKGQLFSGSLCGSSRYPQVPQRVPMNPPTIPDKVPRNSRRDLKQNTFNFNLENVLTVIISSRLLGNSVNINIDVKIQERSLHKYFILRYANIWPATFLTANRHKI